MLGAPIWIIIVCVGLITSAFVALVWHVLRKLVTVVDNLSRIVEQATSDQTYTARMRALDDRLEACEQRSRTAMAQASDGISQFDRLEDRLKSHIARENAAQRQYKVQSQEEVETDEEKEYRELLEAVQNGPAVSDEPQPTNRRRRRRRKGRQRHRGV